MPRPKKRPRKPGDGDPNHERVKKKKNANRSESLTVTAGDAGHGTVPANQKLTAAEFQGLATVPPEAEWFANIQNPRTRRAYEVDLKDFVAFAGIQRRTKGANPWQLQSGGRGRILY